MKNCASELTESERVLIQRALGRRNFVDYNYYVCYEGEEPQTHHKLLCETLDEVIKGKKRRVMVFMPPGSAKSTYSTVRLPAYYLSKTERKGVICASHTAELASSFGRKVRNLVSSKEHRALFNIELASDSKAKGEWETSTGGFYYACGVGGSITGRRGDLGIIDDPVRSRADADSETVRNSTWEWYKADFLTRLKPDASQIIIQTRWHEEDLSGKILPENWQGESGWIDCRDGQKWYVISLPAQAEQNDPLGRKPGEWLWTEWFTKDFWLSIKRSQSKRNWNALYQQIPAAEDGDFFKREWFNKRWDSLPAELEYYIGADYAATEDDGDYTEIGVFGVDANRHVYVVDWFSGQVTSKEWLRELFYFAKKYKINWHAAEPGIIRRMSEATIKDTMVEQSTYFGLNWIGGGNSKEANAYSFRNLCEHGRVYWPRDNDITERVINQLLKAFGGRYDDAIDACSCFGLEITKAWQASPPKKEVKPVKPNNKIPARSFRNRKPVEETIW